MGSRFPSHGRKPAKGMIPLKTTAIASFVILAMLSSSMYAGADGGEASAQAETNWEDWQAAGSSQADEYSCQDAINIFTLEVRHSSCVHAFGYMYESSNSGFCGANPQSRPICWRMESKADGYSGFSATDGKVLAHNHEIVQKCNWYTDPVVASCPTGLTSPKFVWGSSSTPCHHGLGETFVYVGGTYNPTLAEGVPIPNNASFQDDEACP